MPSERLLCVYVLSGWAREQAKPSSCPPALSYFLDGERSPYIRPRQDRSRSQSALIACLRSVTVTKSATLPLTAYACHVNNGVVPLRLRPLQHNSRVKNKSSTHSSSYCADIWSVQDDRRRMKRLRAPELRTEMTSLRADELYTSSLDKNAGREARP
jgi:hypothetical protein